MYHTWILREFSCQGSIQDPTHIPLEDTPDVSPTVYEGFPFFVGVWGSLGYLPSVCGQNHWFNVPRLKKSSEMVFRFDLETFSGGTTLACRIDGCWPGLAGGLNKGCIWRASIFFGGGTSISWGGHVKLDAKMYGMVVKCLKDFPKNICMKFGLVTVGII